MKLLGHIGICAAGVILLLVVPFMFTDGYARLVNGTDTVSSASVVIDEPSGDYTVLINRERHKSESNMAAWREYFSGGDFSIIFDDIGCVTLSGDAGALQMAESLRSRLPENQMKVRTEEPLTALSKAEYGRFDMLLMSDETADIYGISEIVSRNDAEVIHIHSDDKGDRQ